MLDWEVVLARAKLDHILSSIRASNKRVEHIFFSLFVDAHGSFHSTS